MCWQTQSISPTVCHIHKNQTRTTDNSRQQLPNEKKNKSTVCNNLKPQKIHFVFVVFWFYFLVFWFLKLILSNLPFCKILLFISRVSLCLKQKDKNNFFFVKQHVIILLLRTFFYFFKKINIFCFQIIPQFNKNFQNLFILNQHNTILHFFSLYPFFLCCFFSFFLLFLNLVYLQLLLKKNNFNNFHSYSIENFNFL